LGGVRPEKAGVGGSIPSLATTTITHLCTSPSLGLLSNRQRERMDMLMTGKTGFHLVNQSITSKYRALAAI
jgi:hypothetical protein